MAFQELKNERQSLVVQNDFSTQTGPCPCVYNADFTCAGEAMDRALREYGWSINLR